MSRRGAPVLVEGGLRFVFPIAGLTCDDMFRLYVLQKKARDLIELSANGSEKIVAYLVESSGIFENPETRCAQWMKSLGLTSMLQ